MKRLFHFNIKKNILVLMMIVCLCPILSVSYASFVFNTEEYRASEMYIGKLLYGIKINNEAVSEITISPGSHEIIVEVTSLNTISTNYKLVYETNDNIVVRYANDENEPTYGLITTTKSSTLLITNISEEDITIKFNIVGGYKTNELSEITIPESYAEINNDFTKYGYNTISMYVDGQFVETLDNSKYYSLIDCSCTNNEVVKYDTKTSNLLIESFNNSTKCELYFEEVRGIIYDIMLADNPTIKNDSADLFANIADEASESGLFRTTDLTKTKDINGDGTGEEVLYFRGVVENNYLVFAGFCWRIVRTNESGKSIKLRYGGESTITDGVTTCPQTGSDVRITVNGTNTFTYSYNGEYDDQKYIKWVHEVGIDSNAKTIVEHWYTENIELQGPSVTDLIIDETFCNDTSIGGTSGMTIHYGAYTRLVTNKLPQYKCPQDDDKYSVSKGNLSIPVALLTADEVSYAGGKDADNKKYYLNINKPYWLLSPSIWLSSHIYTYIVNANGYLGRHIDESEHGLLPSISLDINAPVAKGGTGEYNNPYVIITN